jgi:hypothetical protein
MDEANKLATKHDLKLAILELKTDLLKWIIISLFISVLITDFVILIALFK